MQPLQPDEIHFQFVQSVYIENNPQLVWLKHNLDL